MLVRAYIRVCVHVYVCGCRCICVFMFMCACGCVHLCHRKFEYVQQQGMYVYLNQEVFAQLEDFRRFFRYCIDNLFEPHHLYYNIHTSQTSLAMCVCLTFLINAVFLKWSICLFVKTKKN